MDCKCQNGRMSHCTKKWSLEQIQNIVELSLISSTFLAKQARRARQSGRGDDLPSGVSMSFVVGGSDFFVRESCLFVCLFVNSIFVLQTIAVSS